MDIAALFIFFFRPWCNFVCASFTWFKDFITTTLVPFTATTSIETTQLTVIISPPIITLITFYRGKVFRLVFFPLLTIQGFSLLVQVVHVYNFLWIFELKQAFVVSFDRT